MKRKAPARSQTLHLRNVWVAEKRTSLRLEPAMWDYLHEIAGRERKTVDELVTELSRHGAMSGLTSSVRLYIAQYYRGLVQRLEMEMEAYGSPATVRGDR